MKTLREEDLRVIREYSGLLYTLDEAFYFILESYDHPEKTNGDRILGDIFASFQQILSSHAIIDQLLEHRKGVHHVIHQFEDILEMSLRFNGKINDFEFKQSYVQHTFAPAFLEWSRRMQEQLKLYTAH